MSKKILMQFAGFESKATAREYTFIVREGSTEPREFPRLRKKRRVPW